MYDHGVGALVLLFASSFGNKHKTHKKEEAAGGSSTGHRLPTGSTQALITLPAAPLF